MAGFTHRLLKNGRVLAVGGLLAAILAWVFGSSLAVWPAIILISAGVMQLRIGSPVYGGARDTGGIGGGGDAGE